MKFFALRPMPACALVAVATLFVAHPAPAVAGVIWYNGDYDQRDALTNGVGIGIQAGTGRENSLVYDRFVIPTGQAWTITSVFSNDQLTYFTSTGGLAPVTTASWEIRSGVSAGNGGTLVANGDTAATQTVVTSTPDFISYFNPEYTIAASVPSIVLGAGTYWLAVAPDDPNHYIGDQSFIETTAGTNAVGPASGINASYINNNLAVGNGAEVFAPTAPILAGFGDNPYPDEYSMGVSGTVGPAVAVPEPASLMLVALGGLAVALARRHGIGVGGRTGAVPA